MEETGPRLRKIRTTRATAERLVPLAGRLNRASAPLARILRFSVPETNRKMNFCSQCGKRVVLRIPDGDNVERYVCDACGTIHYQNPKLVVGCVPEHEGAIVLCRRAIEPRSGYWTMPAGFMENGETLQQAAARESREEALVDVEVGSLLAIVHVLHAHQVHVFFRGRLRTASYGAGTESLEVKLVRPVEIPWSDLAFPSTEFALRHYVDDRAADHEEYHFAELARRF
jgi:ADP-ribose pyrophosphatase YjhB (NUDIX family)